MATTAAAQITATARPAQARMAGWYTDEAVESARASAQREGAAEAGKSVPIALDSTQTAPL